MAVSELTNPTSSKTGGGDGGTQTALRYDVAGGVEWHAALEV